MWSTATTYVMVILCAYWWRLIGTVKRFPCFAPKNLDGFLINCVPENKLQGYVAGSAVISESRVDIADFKEFMIISLAGSGVKAGALLAYYFLEIRTRYDITVTVLGSDVLIYGCCFCLWFQTCRSAERRGHWTAVLGTWMLLATTCFSTAYLDAPFLTKHWINGPSTGENTTGESLVVTEEDVRKCGEAFLTTGEWWLDFVWGFGMMGGVVRGFISLWFHMYHAYPRRICIPIPDSGVKQWSFSYCALPYRLADDVLMHWPEEFREDLERLARSVRGTAKAFLRPRSAVAHSDGVFL